MKVILAIQLDRDPMRPNRWTLALSTLRLPSLYATLLPGGFSVCCTCPAILYSRTLNESLANAYYGALALQYYIPGPSMKAWQMPIMAVWNSFESESEPRFNRVHRSGYDEALLYVFGNDEDDIEALSI